MEYMDDETLLRLAIEKARSDQQMKQRLADAQDLSNRNANRAIRAVGKLRSKDAKQRRKNHEDN